MATSYIQEVLADDPVVALQCNEASGTVLADATGKGHAATLSGAVVMGRAPMSPGLGTAVQFTGGSAQFAQAADLNASGDYAVEFVAKFSDTTTGFKQVFGPSTLNRAPNIFVNYPSAGQMVFRDDLSNNTLVYTAVDGVYRHYVFTRRGDVLELWVNGVLVRSITMAVGAADPVRPYALMSGALGTLDEFAFYGHTLLPARIQAHAARALALKKLAGVAKLDTGAAASLVLVRSWTTHQHLAEVVPANDGSWEASVGDGLFEITTLGPSGYQPVCHGPVASVPD